MPCAQYALLYYAMCISHFRTPQKPQDPYTHTNTHYIPKYRLPHGFTQKKKSYSFYLRQFTNDGGVAAVDVAFSSKMSMNNKICVDDLNDCRFRLFFSF